LRNSENNFVVYLRIFFSFVFISIFIFIVNRTIDYLIISHHMPFFRKIFASDIGNFTNTLGGLGEVVTAVLGVEFTAVAIIAQLAANKYSSDVMIIFIKNRVNVLVFSLFLLTAINTILVTNTLTENFITYYSIFFNLILITISLIIIMPHLLYVFNFLQPQNFIQQVKKESLNILQEIAKDPDVDIYLKREEFYEKIEFIRDIGTNSVSQGDGAVALLCVTAMKEILVEHMEIKNQLPAEWFKRSGNEYLDPDFSGYSKFVINSIEKSRTFIERKVFRSYDLIFNNARKTLRDVAAGVLLNSGLIGQAAISVKDEGALNCTFRYFNSYLRFAINDHDPRSAFNTLEHYRVIAEHLLDSDPLKVEQVAFYFKYYALEAQKQGVFFILETAAHDLCVLNELAYLKNAKNLRELLYIFLNLDQPLEEVDSKLMAQREISLIGVRIAQVKLAGFYLLKDEEELARLIYEDMKVEPLDRIHKIYEFIYTTTLEEFWEITPRGINFYYVPPERKKALEKFFKWFDKV